MKKLVFIANNMAGKGKAWEIVRQAQRFIYGWECELKCSTSPEEALEFCQALDNESCEGVFLAGGDGTINRALPGLVKKGIPLGIIPTGTSNDFAQELGFSLDWEMIQRIVDNGSYDPIDLIEVNGLPFATAGGIGVGSFVTSEFNRRRDKSLAFRLLSQRLKGQIYSVLSAKTILLQQDYIHHLRITSENFNQTLRTAVLFVCNQAFLGDDLLVAPDARNDDAKFNVLVSRGFGRKELIHVLIDLKKGKSPKDSVHFVSRHLVIEDLDNRPIQVFGDGETLAESPRLEFEIIPKALQVYRYNQSKA